jgi:phosphatidylglycerol:prolipoprotein diacylglycerol transferase
MLPSPGECLTAAGYLVGALVFGAMARQRRVATEGFALLALAALCGGVVVARLAQWIPGAEPGDGARWLEMLVPRNGGRTILGGVAGGWLALVLMRRHLGIARPTGDLFAPALAAGEAVGRLGCFVNGCCYGKTCQLPWSIFQHGAWRHPTQLYAAAWCALLFALLWQCRERWQHPGDAWRVYLVLWGLGRFIVEIFRVHVPETGGLSTAQLFCLVIMAAGLLGLQRSRTAQGAAQTIG